MSGARCEACGLYRQCEDDGRHDWPELVGVEAQVAKAEIERTNRRAEVMLVGCYPEAASATMNCCCNRVLLWVTDFPNGRVCAIPRVG